jgi:hypothetical protein
MAIVGCLQVTAALSVAGMAPALHAGRPHGLVLDPPRFVSMAQRGLYAAWNPQDAAASNRPGLKIAFFGTPPTCEAGAHDGPVAAPTSDRATQLLKLTGLGPSSPDLEWSPSRDASKCASHPSDFLDNVFVALSQSPDQGGVGLFTGSGPDRNGQTGFMAPYAARGQNGRGANAHIEASFVSIRFDWRQPDVLRPWGGNEGATLRIRSRQSVVASETEKSASGHPIQVKQQLTLGLINAACMTQAAATPRPPCQLKYLLTIAIFRADIDDWSRVNWFRSARILFDAGQGGIPVIDAPIAAPGASVSLRDNGPVLMTSQGAATQHRHFANETFDVRMDWRQFMSGLRSIAAVGLHRPAANASDAEVARLFGTLWKDPGQWAVASVSIGQEVSNPDPDRRANIGGALHTIEVETVH